jgi:hypothetical protein
MLSATAIQEGEVDEKLDGSTLAQDASKPVFPNTPT